MRLEASLPGPDRSPMLLLYLQTDWARADRLRTLLFTASGAIDNRKSERMISAPGVQHFRC